LGYLWTLVFAESDRRPISPWSTLSLQEYVDSLIALGNKESPDYASFLAQDHPAWMVKIVPRRAKLGIEEPSLPSRRHI
jgi:hypothetical protein